jgi:type IV secretory pathway VirB2 component (pilin)
MKNTLAIFHSIPLHLARLGTFAYLQLHAVKALAQGFGGPTPSIGSAPAGGDIRSAVLTTLNFVLGFLALLAVVFIIVGGFRIVTAGGNEENVTKGRKIIIYALIGLVVVFFANVIVGFITSELAGEF